MPSSACIDVVASIAAKTIEVFFIIVVLFFNSKILLFQDIEHKYSDKQRIDEQ